MKNKLAGVVEFMFINGGIAKKSGNPYLQVSNGRSEFFINIPKTLKDKIDEDTFSEYNDGDMIALNVEVVVGSDRVTLTKV